MPFSSTINEIVLGRINDLKRKMLPSPPFLLTSSPFLLTSPSSFATLTLLIQLNTFLSPFKLSRKKKNQTSPFKFPPKLQQLKKQKRSLILFPVSHPRSFSHSPFPHPRDSNVAVVVLASWLACLVSE